MISTGSLYFEIVLPQEMWWRLWKSNEYKKRFFERDGHYVGFSKVALNQRCIEVILLYYFNKAIFANAYLAM